ncbi:MAG: DUF2953 domain-containing protein [Christensenellales bacterium]
MYKKNRLINNIDMVNPLFTILLLLLLIFVLQLTINAKLSFNIKKNCGKLELKFLNIKVLDFTLRFHLDYLQLTNKKGKNFYMPLEFNEQTIEEYNNFQTILFKKTYFKSLSVFLNFGFKDDAFLTSMICGYFDIITKSLYSFLRTKKNEVEFVSKIYPNYKKNVIKFAVKAKLSMSIYDLIWSYLEAKLTSKIKLKRSKKNARQQNRKLNGASH